MNGITITTNLNKISYICHLNGDMEPYINIHPGVSLPNGVTITKFPLNHLIIPEGMCIPTERGSRISIFVPFEEGQRPILVEADQNNTDFTGEYVTCPICGEPVHPTDNYLSLGRCLNRSCPAQMHHGLLYFLVNIGMPITSITLSILRYILARGLVSTFDKVFWLGVESIWFPYLSLMDVQWFLNELHGLRGMVSLDQLMRAIRIHDWKEDECDMLSEIIKTEGLSLINWNKLLDPVLQAKYPELNWGPFNTFMSIEPNLRLISNLVHILYQ